MQIHSVLFALSFTI